MLTFVNKTYSETGQVKLASREPQASRWWSSTCCPTGATSIA